MAPQVAGSEVDLSLIDSIVHIKKIHFLNIQGLKYQMKKLLFLLFLVFVADNTFAQTLSETDSLKLEQFRRESGVDKHETT